MRAVSVTRLGLTDRQVRRLTVASMVSVVVAVALARIVYDRATGSSSPPSDTSSESWIGLLGFAMAGVVFVVAAGTLWSLITRSGLRSRGVVLSASGIDITRGWMSKQSAPWAEVRTIRTERRSFGRTVLVVDIGRDVVAPAPFASSWLGGWFDDPDFEDKVDTIGEWRRSALPPIEDGHP